MLPESSFFRRPPVGLEAKFRRLLAGVAYAWDGADLARRLRGAARRLYSPGDAKAERQARMTPARRLAIVTDTWTIVDNLARLRAIATRFPIGDPAPSEFAPFLQATAPVKAMRNRGQHLDEDYANDAHFAEQYPVFGTVTWVDPRYPGGDLRCGVISGPVVNPRGDAKLLQFQLRPPANRRGVSGFQLMAFDRTLDIDDAVSAGRKFVTAFEETARRSVLDPMRSAALAQGHDPERLLAVTPCDMTVSVAFKRNGERWSMLPSESIGLAEVPPGGGGTPLFPADALSAALLQQRERNENCP